MNEHVQPNGSGPLFNPLAPDFIRDPYPYYERLRTTDPVHLSQFGSFVASRHAEVTQVMRDKRFGKDYVGRMTRRHGAQVLDEPVYRSMRWDAATEGRTNTVWSLWSDEARQDRKARSPDRSASGHVSRTQ